MVRRAWTILTALALCLILLPVFASAASQEEKDELYASTRRSYTASVSASGRGSFHGYCGSMVAYQLRHLKITGKVNKANGNQMFDRYAKKAQSSGGYYITPYSAKEYSLEEALNAISHNGTKDVYNILVGFQWTNTEAGARYGHTVFINGILDGTVYFAESYDSAIGGKEGSVIRLSIAEFARYYDRWTRFEGCIHFNKEFAESMKNWDADLVVINCREQPLLSQPAPAGEESCQQLRTVREGERLLVSKILCDGDGRWYYRVEDEAYSGYVLSENTAFMQVKGSGLHTEDLSVSDWLVSGQTLQLSGTLRGKGVTLAEVVAVVTDRDERVVATWSCQPEGEEVELTAVELPVLPDGTYRLTVTARGNGWYVSDNTLCQAAAEKTVAEHTIHVGSAAHVYGLRTGYAVPNGWVQQDGSWYYYENGTAKTGWFRCDGLNYYFREDGTAVTGWAQINGQTCLFSATGAMCTGWIRTEQGLYYCSEGGRFANGLQVIDGMLCYFADGILQTSGTATVDGVLYTLDGDGQARPAAQ